MFATMCEGGCVNEGDSGASRDTHYNHEPDGMKLDVACIQTTNDIIVLHLSLEAYIEHCLGWEWVFMLLSRVKLENM